MARDEWGSCLRAQMILESRIGGGGWGCEEEEHGREHDRVWIFGDDCSHRIVHDRTAETHKKHLQRVSTECVVLQLRDTHL